MNQLITLLVCFLIGSYSSAFANAEAINVDKLREQALKECRDAAMEQLQARQPADSKWREHETEYQGWRLGYTKHVFLWHFCTSIAIFFLVSGIVLFGLWLSYLQFRKDFVGAHKPGDVDTERPQQITGGPVPAEGHESDQSGSATHSSLKVGLHGIEVSSSIIGLLILVLSLAFFYLYLSNVYPVFDRLPSPLK